MCTQICECISRSKEMYLYIHVCVHIHALLAQEAAAGEGGRPGYKVGASGF